jgi:hypothetical protein
LREHPAATAESCRALLSAGDIQSETAAAFFLLAMFESYERGVTRTFSSVVDGTRFQAVYRSQDEYLYRYTAPVMYPCLYWCAY